MSLVAEARGDGEEGAAGRSVILAGTTGLVGRFLLPLLLERGFRVVALSRRPPTGDRTRDASLRWSVLDLRARPTPTVAVAAEALFHAAPLWLLPGWLPSFRELGLRRLVAFSSTSRQTKLASANAAERETARRLAEAEEAIAGSCRAGGVRFTILRPTLVYGEGRDRNVSAIARFIRRYRFFPVAGAGRGLRQPVHAADLAAAALAVLDNASTFDRSYDLPGGETLSYLQMVTRIAEAVGRRPRILHLPTPVLRGCLVVASRLPGLGHLTPEVATRMDRDLVFDAAAARRDFGYDPRPFRSLD